MLAIGMSAKEFWRGMPRLAVAYRDAAKIERENRYQAEWRQGVYVYEALLSASAFFREWSKGLEHKYPDAPVFGEAYTARKQEEDDAKAAMERNMHNFLKMMNLANSRFEERESASDE